MSVVFRYAQFAVLAAMLSLTALSVHAQGLRVSNHAKSQLFSLADVEREHILHVLELSGWRICGHGGATEILGLKASTLES